MKKNVLLILIFSACIFYFKTAFAFAQVDCGWSCSGTVASCKAGGDYNWTGYCDDGSQGNCHEFCQGSINGDVNCGGVVQHISCNTLWKDQQGCCNTNPPQNPTNTPTPIPPTATPTVTPIPPTATVTPIPPSPTGCPALCVYDETRQVAVDAYCDTEAAAGRIASCNDPSTWKNPMACQASEPRDPATNRCTWGPYGSQCTPQSCACICLSTTGSITPSPTPTTIPACHQDKFITLSAPPTITLTPTPTSSTSAGLVRFKVKLQGVEYDNIAKDEYKTQKVRVVFQVIKKMADGTYQSLLSKTFNDVTIKAVKATSGKIAIWEGEVTPTGVNIGTNYVMFIKGSKHLQRKICQNNPTEAAEQGFPYRCLGEGQITLTNGVNTFDFSNILLQGGDLPAQDGIVNAYDVSRILDILKLGESTKLTDLNVADIDLNGIVNAKDRSYLIETLEEKYGDEE